MVPCSDDDGVTWLGWASLWRVVRLAVMCWPGGGGGLAWPLGGSRWFRLENRFCDMMANDQVGEDRIDNSGREQ